MTADTPKWSPRPYKSYPRRDGVDWAGLTPEKVAAMKAQYLEIEEYNRAIYLDKYHKYQEAVEIFVAINPMQNMRGKLKKYSPLSPPSSYRNDIDRWVEEAKQAVEKKDREKKRADEMLLLESLAIIFLQARGKKLGEEFTSKNAIEMANEIAFEETLAKKKEESGFVSFSGDDFCENCSGWDGKSHRCECGNRRVSWVMPDWHRFDRPAVSAEAH